LLDPVPQQVLIFFLNFAVCTGMPLEEKELEREPHRVVRLCNTDIIIMYFDLSRIKCASRLRAEQNECVSEALFRLLF
jgi:hypothetical protein